MYETSENAELINGASSSVFSVEQVVVHSNSLSQYYS